ncbi:hypothetical protein BH09BAC5_BH09BAC5_03270 [soil metagenome]
MNTQQLTGWMKEPASLGKEASAQLDSLTQTYPFFQTAQLLYIKSLHNENSFLYNNQLKVSAVYATNRKVLYELITKKGKGGEGRESKEKSSEFRVSGSELEEKNRSEENIEAKTLETKNTEPEIVIQPDFPKKRFTKDEDDWESGMMRQLQLLHHWKTSPQEILNKRIEEINAEKAKKEAEIENEPTAADEINTLLYVLVEPGNAEDVSETEEISAEEVNEEQEENWAVKILEEDNNSPNPISETNNFPKDEFSQEILREAINSSIELEVGDEMPGPEDFGYKSVADKKPSVIEKPTEKEDQIVSEELSFTSWLNQLSNAEIKEETSEKEPVKSQLIDKFIQESPRIQTNKTKFFSPVNMAKKSVQDNDEFITETLAKIYIKQGNISKGIRAYQKLSLKFPEKSSYFAALIEELKRTPKP